VYNNTYQTALAPEYSRRAFGLRNRVSERERFFISWRYYRDAIQAWDKALDIARSWTTTYPREAFAYNSLGSALLRFGQYDQALEPLRKAIELDPKFVPPYGNLAAALMALDRFDEASAVLQQAADRKLEFVGARRIGYLLAFLRGDAETMAKELEASVGMRQTNQAFGWQARVSTVAGQLNAAHEQFRRGIQISLQQDFKEVAAQLTADDAEAHATLGQCGVARTEVASALELSRDNGTLERSSRALALCGASEVSGLMRELETRFPEATLILRVQLPLSAAALAIRRGEAQRAIDLLEPVRRYDHAPGSEFWPAYLRGQAYLQLKNAAAADTEFQSIVNHRGEVPASVLYPLAHLGVARASVLAGDRDKARKSYQTFLDFWKDADAGLEPLRVAREELARLRSGT
jgi:tetratricopeptide (TPR) repeat protein